MALKIRSSHNCFFFKLNKKRQRGHLSHTFWERSSLAYGKWEVPQHVGDDWSCQFYVLLSQETFFAAEEVVLQNCEKWVHWWTGVSRQGQVIGYANSTTLVFRGRGMGGVENILPIPPWRFGNGALSLGSSSAHNYALFPWVKYNPKLLKCYRLQKWDKSVSIREPSKSEYIGWRDDRCK